MNGYSYVRVLKLLIMDLAADFSDEETLPRITPDRKKLLLTFIVFLFEKVIGREPGQDGQNGHARRPGAL